MWGKHYRSMYTGSMYGAGSTVFAVWGYVVSHTDRNDHTVELNPHALAGTLGDVPDAVTRAIEFLCAPDPRSRSKEEEGRRLVKEGEYLFRVVNSPVYQEIRSDTDRKQYMRDYMRRRRQGTPATKPTGDARPNRALRNDNAEGQTVEPRVKVPPANPDDGLDGARASLGALYRRSPGARWTQSEDYQLCLLVRRPAFVFELREILDYHRRIPQEKLRFDFPATLAKLLTHDEAQSGWQETLDKARTQHGAPPIPPPPRPPRIPTPRKPGEQPLRMHFPDGDQGTDDYATACHEYDNLRSNVKS